MTDIDIDITLGGLTLRQVHHGCRSHSVHFRSWTRPVQRNETTAPKAIKIRHLNRQGLRGWGINGRAISQPNRPPILQPLYKSTCISPAPPVKNWRILLVQSFTASMPLLTATTCQLTGEKSEAYLSPCFKCTCNLTGRRSGLWLGR